MRLIRVLVSAMAILFFSWSVCGSMAAKQPEEKVGASDFEYEFSLGWGGYPAADVSTVFGYSFGCCDVVPFRDYRLSDIYREYEGSGYLTGLISAQFGVKICKWFTVSVGVGVCGAYQNIYDPVTRLKSGRNSGAVISVLPEAKFYWLNKNVVRMYSSVGLGVTYSYFKDSAYGETDIAIYPACQFNPVGIALGRKVYGFAEFGIGTQYIGAKAGVGVRF